MNDLEEQIAKLEKRIAWDTEQLHSLANEQRHREHGCDYAPVDSEELDEVVDVLLGKTEV
ncbi:MAG: hypothetical protein ACREBJ_00150 [Nitrosotalea sp.]